MFKSREIKEKVFRAVLVDQKQDFTYIFFLKKNHKNLKNFLLQTYN
jgi:hypothetical protein